MKPLDEHDPRWELDLSGEQGLGEEDQMSELTNRQRLGEAPAASDPSWHFVLLAIALGLVMALITG